MESLGFLAALGAALAWGSYTVPFKKAKNANFILFQALTTTGIGLSGLFFAILLGFSLSLNIFGFGSGILWAVANVISLVAIINLGIAMSVPIMSSLVVLGSFIWGVVVFGEMPQGIIQGIAGIGLIVLGVILVGTVGNTARVSIKKGLAAAILAGLIWSSQLAPIKFGGVATKDCFISICLGILLTGWLIFFISRTRLKKGLIKLSLLSGLIWNVGNLLSLTALSLIGLSKTGPISQTAALVAVLWGLFYFKEITNRYSKLQILIGAIILVIGIITLGLA